MLTEQHPVQKGKLTRTAVTPVQWDKGRGLPEEGAQGRDICLSLRVHRRGLS